MSKLVFIGDLEQYQKECSGLRKKQYIRLLDQAKRYKTMELPEEHPKESTTYMGIATVNLALAYRLSGDESYLAEARRFMNTVCSYEKWGNAHLVNVDLSASWILFGLSLGYDWLKEFLSKEEQVRIYEKIRHHAQIIYDYKRDTFGHGWSTNFYQNHNWINMTGLAAAGYALKGQCPEAAVYTEEAKRNFKRVFSYLADDGSNYEGVTYWRYGGMWLFVYAHLLKLQEGIDYFKTSNYLKNTFYYRLYQSAGDFKQQLNYGDCHDRHSGHVPCVYYKTAAEYKDGFAQAYGNMVIDHFLMEEAAQSKVKPGILPEAAFEFLWYDPSVEEKALSLLPKARYFADLGLLGIRENWTPDSRAFTIKCGYPGGKKQWFTGFKLLKEENIHCLSLSHHHPDNLSYLFTRGGEYLTCEDGYNRNLMPDNHNVILVDGTYTDVKDVNDVYVKSAELRMEQEGPDFKEASYGGSVTAMEMDGDSVLYRAETTGIYPKALEMEEVSRLLFTDGLSFWVFVDVCRSRTSHHYEIISNTDLKAQKQGDGSYLYPLKSGAIRYQVFSHKTMQEKQYGQQVVSVMTTQEPDKVCKTEIETLTFETEAPEQSAVLMECFTFVENNAAVSFDGGKLTVKQKGKEYTFRCGEDVNEKGLLPVVVTVTEPDGSQKVYRA